METKPVSYLWAARLILGGALLIFFGYYVSTFGISDCGSACPSPSNALLTPVPVAMIASGVIMLTIGIIYLISSFRSSD